MELSQSELTIWIVLVCLGLGVLSLLAQIIVSLVAAGKARSAATGTEPDEPNALAMVFTSDEVTATEIGLALEADKAAADAAAEQAKSTTALMELLGKLSSTVPLGIIGVLLIVIGAVVNGSLLADISLGN